MQADSAALQNQPQTSPPTLRRANNADRDAIVQLHSEGHELVGVSHDPNLDSDLEDVEGTYLSRGGEFLVITEDDRVIGMGGFRKLDSRHVELRRLRVAREAQRRGLGRCLLRRLVEEGATRGFKSMVLDASAEMTEARALFSSEGFELEREGEFFGLEVFFYRRSLA